MSERGRPPGDGAIDDLDVAGLLPPLDGAPGPAQRLSSARSSAMVAAVLDAVSAGAGRAGGAPRSPSGRRPGPGDQPVRAGSPLMHDGIADGRPGAASPRVRSGSGRGRAGASLSDTRPGSSARARATTSSISPFEVTRTVSLEDASRRAARRPRQLVRRGVVIAAVLAAASVASGAAAIWIGSAAAPPPEATAAARAPAGPPVAPPVERAASLAASGGSTDPGRADEPERAEPEPERAEPEPERAEPEPERAEPEPERAEPEPERAEPEPERAEPPRRERREPSRRRPPRPRRAEPAADEPEPERAAPAPAVAEPSPLPPDAPVEDVVALANQRRKEKRWRAADALYERVMRESAGSDAAAIATVASASLHLDHLADPAGALRRFQKALRLRPGGPLAEEARWGLAETHRALEDDGAERTALRAFLSAHPRSVNAERARQRLAELGAP